MAWTGLTSFETTDGSTTPTDGNDIQGTGDGTGWSGNWTASNDGGYLDYDNGQANDGTWSFVLDTYTAHVNKQPRIYRDLTTGVTAGHIAFDIRCNVDDRDTPVIRLRSGSGNNIPIEFVQTSTGTGRTLKCCGTSFGNLIAVDTWYKIGVDFDCATDTLDFYLDDVKQNGSAVSFTAAASSIDRFWVENNAASGYSSTLGNMFWIDNIRAGEAAASGIKSIAEIAQADIKNSADIKSMAGLTN